MNWGKEQEICPPPGNYVPTDEMIRQSCQSNIYWRNIFGVENTISQSTIKLISSHVGDDIAAISNNLVFLLLILFSLEEICHCKISLTDTSLNNRVIDFSEGLVVIPRSREETYQYWSRAGDNEPMGFIEVPKLRLSTASVNQRQKFSDLLEGKFEAFAQTHEYSRTQKRFQTAYEVTNLYQDATLGAVTADSSPYMPKSLGGSGKKVPFENISNFITFHKVWKTGSYLRLYGNLIKEVNLFFDSYQRGNPTRRGPGIEKLLSMRPVFHDWVKGQAMPEFYHDLDKDLEEYVVGTYKWNTPVGDVISRLCSSDTNLVVTETELKVAHEHNTFTQMILSGDSIVQTKEKLKAARGDWYAGLRPALLWKELEPLYDGRGEEAFTAIEVPIFLERTKDPNLFRMMREEKVYLRSALDLLYYRGCMNVKETFSLMPITVRHEIFPWEEGERVTPDPSENAKMVNLLAWLRNQVGPIPEGIERDEGIIYEIETHLSVIPQTTVVITDDIMLCKRIADKFGILVNRVPASVEANRLLMDEPSIEGELKADGWTVYVDGPSVGSAVEKAELAMYTGGISQKAIPIKSTDLWNERPSLEDIRVDLGTSLPHDWPNANRFRFDARGLRRNLDSRHMKPRDVLPARLNN